MVNLVPRNIAIPSSDPPSASSTIMARWSGRKEAPQRDNGPIGQLSRNNPRGTKAKRRHGLRRYRQVAVEARVQHRGHFRVAVHSLDANLDDGFKITADMAGMDDHD
jgi:hypothetical protein